MNDTLETALLAARWWRDFGNEVLIVGIAAEIFIETLKTESSNFTPPQAYRRELTKKGALILAGLLVLIGVVLEMRNGDLADDISDRISNVQQSKIIALETRLASRSLTPQQEAFVVDALKSYAGMTFTVITYLSDPEPASFAAKISAVLKEAKWVLVPTNAELMTPTSGVFVTVNNSIVCDTSKIAPCPPRIDPREFEAAKILVSALREVDIAVADVDQGPSGVETAITIHVAHKP